MGSNNTTVLITGNTYPVKDQIKALGGRWDAVAKGWRVPAAKAAHAQALVSHAPKGYVRTAEDVRSDRSRRAPRGRWTGCSCGSREDEARASDCASCQHDY